MNPALPLTRPHPSPPPASPPAPHRSCSFEIKRAHPAGGAAAPAFLNPSSPPLPMEGGSEGVPSIAPMPVRTPQLPSALPTVSSGVPQGTAPAMSEELSEEPSAGFATVLVPRETPAEQTRSLPAPIKSAPVQPVPSASVSAAQTVPLPRPISTYPAAHKATITVQPFSVQQEVLKEPSLPRVKQPQLTSHRHSRSPNFALSLLEDIAAIVEGWQAEIEALHNQIQAIYLDGPIIDGWLEAEATLDGVIQGYRLCGLNEHGQMWARPCPPDQLPGVSTAIARYQHLRQITAQKQTLEMRFQQLGETLAMVRGSL